MYNIYQMENNNINFIIDFKKTFNLLENEIINGYLVFKDEEYLGLLFNCNNQYILYKNIDNNYYPVIMETKNEHLCTLKEGNKEFYSNLEKNYVEIIDNEQNKEYVLKYLNLEK